MKKTLLLPLAAALFASASLLTACNTNPASQAPATPAAQAQAAQDSVLAQHERLMGQADQVVALAATLQNAAHPPRPLLAKLQAADQNMMTWMHHYQNPDSTAPAPQRLAYLQDQLHQLAALQQQMRTALDSAKVAARRAAPAPAATSAPAAR